jgi:serine/tyrosine/threonine adenylyltransferase
MRLALVNSMPHTFKQFPISSLQIVSKSQSLQHNLLPDPLTPSHAAFENIIKSKPSVQRRSRLVDSGSHFSFVTPFHIPFPFRIEIPDDSPDVELDKAAYVEKWLSDREALEEVDPIDQDLKQSLFKYSNSKDRSNQPPPQLLGLAEQAIEDCLPNLDLGDALTVIDPNRSENVVNGTNRSNNPERRASIREELVDVVSGRVVLMSHPSKPTDTGPYLPWSLRYCGHQFGQWAGQLGDGRAISIS